MVGAFFLYVLSSPTPAGAHPPSGQIGVLTVFGWILLAAGVILAAAGLYSTITGRSPYPVAWSRRLRRVPATPHDQRLIGGGLISFGAAALVGASAGLVLANQPPGPSLLVEAGPPIGWILLVLALILVMTARQTDRRTSQVQSGWEQIARVFRS